MKIKHSELKPGQKFLLHGELYTKVECAPELRFDPFTHAPALIAIDKFFYVHTWTGVQDFDVELLPE